MKIAVYSPYLDTLGGGERYMLTIAEILSLKDKVDILLDSHLYVLDTEKILQTSEERFGLDLSRINLVEAPLGADSSSIKRALFLMNYDLLFYLTDGSIFYPTSTKNILHIQSPVVGQPAKNLWGKIKLSGWDKILYNSKFTQDNSKKFWNLKSQVVYPPVDVESIKPLEKKKYILSVGRFFKFQKSKKHELLIKAFKDLSEKIPGWSLILVGAAGFGDEAYVEELQNLSKGSSVKILPNLKYTQLTKLYGESSIYWHAAGYGENDPTKMEHFGISTVEAMAGGCVPVVINKGGQLEIIEDKKSGYFWDSLEDLKTLTLKLINDDSLRERLSRNGLKRSENFSKKRFKESILELSCT